MGGILSGGRRPCRPETMLGQSETRKAPTAHDCSVCASRGRHDLSGCTCHKCTRASVSFDWTRESGRCPERTPEFAHFRHLQPLARDTTKSLQESVRGVSSSPQQAQSLTSPEPTQGRSDWRLPPRNPEEPCTDRRASGRPCASGELCSGGTWEATGRCHLGPQDDRAELSGVEGRATQERTCRFVALLLV